MLDGVFVALLIIAFIITYISEEKESIIYSMLGFILWLMLVGQSLWIVDIAGNQYHEFGISAFCLAFVFVHIILMIMYFMDWKKARRAV